MTSALPPSRRPIGRCAALVALLAATGCVSFHHSERREVLERRPGPPRRLGVTSQTDGGAFSASLSGADLVLAFASGSGRCVYQEILHETVVTVHRHQPAHPGWRVGGPAWLVTGGLGLAGLGGGVWLVASSSHHAPDLRRLERMGGGALAVLGTAALVQWGQVWLASRTSRAPPQVEERPLSTFERSCEPEPMAAAALRLRRGPVRVELATDRSGQVRLRPRDSELLGISSGTWEVESLSGRRLGSLAIPSQPPSEATCQGERIRYALRPLHVADGAGPDAGHLAASALEQLRRVAGTSCHRPVAGDERPHLHIAGSVLPSGGIWMVQLTGISPTRLSAVPDATSTTLAAPTEAGLVSAVARGMDALLSTVASEPSDGGSP